jgi:hypothetical protein
MPRKYFSGGISDLAMKDVPLTRTTDAAMLGAIGKLFRTIFFMKSNDAHSQYSAITGIAPFSLQGRTLSVSDEMFRFFRPVRLVALATAVMLYAVGCSRQDGGVAPSDGNAVARQGVPQEGDIDSTLSDRGLSVRALGVERHDLPTPTGTVEQAIFTVSVSSDVPFKIAFVQGYQNGRMVTVTASHFVQESNGELSRNANFYFEGPDGRVQAPVDYQVTNVDLHNNTELDLPVMLSKGPIDDVVIIIKRSGQADSVFMIHGVKGLLNRPIDESKRDKSKLRVGVETPFPDGFVDTRGTVNVSLVQVNSAMADIT